MSRLAILLFATAFLIALPAEIRMPTASEGPAIWLATAMADDDDGGDDDDDDDDGGNDDGGAGGGDDDDGGDDDGGAGGGDDDDGGDDDGGAGDDDDGGGDDDGGAGDGDDDDGGGGDNDDSGSDDDTDRSDAAGPDRSNNEDRGGPEDRGASSREIGSRTIVDRDAVPQNAPAASAIGQALGQRQAEPGTAPTESGVARVRAMVEIARDLGAATPAPADRLPISGAVTQDMLDAAEQRYVDAVKDAWEAHGFPWNDSEVLGALDKLDSLVSALESIMRDQHGGPVGARIATDFNDDGFVDINDLWDAHQR